MIILGSPSDLPGAVRQYREDQGRSRGQVALWIAAGQLRRVDSINNQIAGWERPRGVSPQLLSLDDYLKAHDLRLALIENGEP